MRKIILSGLLASSLFSADNLVTIIENNSLLKIAKNNISSYVDKTTINIGEGFTKKTFQNYSPYYFTEYQSSEELTPTIITMIGEKSIQYGSIYSKGFGEKYNINSLGVFVKNKKYSLALKTLDYFNKNDLMYVRTKHNNYSKEDFYEFEAYIDNNVEKTKQERYKNRLSFIYDILDYTNSIYEYQSNNINIYPINTTLFDLKAALDNSNFIDESKTTKEYQYDGETLNRYCMSPVINETSDGDGGYSYNVTYEPIIISGINVKKPIPLTDLYEFKNKSCPSLVKKKKWSTPTISYDSSMPSITEQKSKMLMQIKNSRNGGIYLEKMKNLYNHLNIDTQIKNSLKKLNSKGINYGKVLHVNYGLSEGVSNDSVNLSVLKTVTTGSIYNDKINLIMNEGFTYNTNNVPSSLQDKTDTMSELSKNDQSGNSYNTLYYVVNQKIQNNVPEKGSLFSQQLKGIPDNSYSMLSTTKADGEIMWLTNKDGTYIDPFKYVNENEILLDTEESIDEQQMIDGMLKYSRSQIDGKENAKSYYPLNLKGISISYVPLNNEQETAVKYFGPRYSYDLYLDKYTKVTKVEKKLNCAVDSCTAEENKSTNPTRMVEETTINYYCGLKVHSPDTQYYKYLAFKDIFNRIVEEPYGELRYHYYKTPFETNYELFNSNTIVPNIYKYVGQVNDDKECLSKVNFKLEENLRDELITNKVYNFDFTKEIPDNDTTANEEFASQSTIVTAMIDDHLANKTPLVKSYGNDIIFNEYTSNVNYEEFKGSSTFYNMFNEMKTQDKSIQYGEVNEIPTIIKNPEVVK